MTSGTATSSGRRKYQQSNMNTSGTTGTTTLARRSQTMKVSKLMNGNPRLPPSTPSSCHSYRPPGHHNTMNSRQKERPTSFHDSPFTSSSTHRLDEQSGHSLKTQTLSTRRAGHGGTVTNYSKTPSTLFRNSSVCNLERDVGPTVMKSTKSGTVLLENRRKGVGSASTTSLWDDQNYIHRYNGHGKLGTKSSTKNGMNVSPNHQSLHHLPSSTPSSSSSADSPNNNQRSSNLTKKHSLCHLPPPDYSDSGNNSFHPSFRPSFNHPSFL